MEGNPFDTSAQFNNPQEELAFLKEQVALRERQLQEKAPQSKPETLKEEAVKDVVESYKEESHEVIHEDMRHEPEHSEAISLKLSPEAHDRQIEELFGMLLEHGLKNTLAVIERMNNPHIEDDFHRFLVQYFAATHDVPGLKEKTPLYKSLSLRLYEVTLPAARDEEKDFKAVLGAMQQFYAGMQSVASDVANKEKNYYTIEIAQSANGNDVVVYAAVPESKFHLFEKQVLSFYQKAKITEVTDDYNIFSERGAIVASYGSLRNVEAFPVRTHEEIDHDPMNAVINAFSKLKEGEGAAIQFVIAPAGESYMKKFAHALEKIKKGEKPKDALADGFAGAFAKVGKDFLFGASQQKIGENGLPEAPNVDDRAVEAVTKKIQSTIVSVSVRIVASAETKAGAEDVVEGLESTFNQFDSPLGNGFTFTRVKDRKIQDFLHMYSYRMPNSEHMMPLNLDELSTVFHFPVGVTSSPDLKEAKAGDAPAPAEVSQAKDGIVLGLNSYRGKETKVMMSREDRMRHMYVIGQTGTGKTTILKNMIAQDIKNGDGCCFIDPHGSDIQDILSYVPKERIDDVIYFDPASIDRPMGLNMLEYDTRFPEQKTFVVNELMGIFNKLFSKESMGPMFEQYFKNSAFLAMDDPNRKATLLDITRILGDKAFRDSLLATCQNPIVKEFWVNAEKTTGDQSIANFVPYITSKFDNFISNDIMRPVVLQEDSAFNFREIMDNKKILLVNLSKGRLGEINADLIGLLLVGKIQMAALSRADAHGQEMNDFYLYIDEFQNVTTDSISSILSEARKYRLSLTVAHQYIKQLTDNIRDAVFGNVGSMAVYRISTEDAEFVQPKFDPLFSASDITKLDNFNSYVSMLAGGVPVKPFSMRSHWSMTQRGDMERVEKIKELSFLKYGRPRAEVEAEIMAKYKKPDAPKPLDGAPSV
jgi:Ni2+-binding GTPase involved in maturation of urease and hydrogenase